MKKYWQPCCPSTKFVRKNLRRQKHSACLMRQVRWSSIRLTTFLWQAVLVLEDLLYSSGHIPSWCSSAFPNVGTKAWSAQPSIFSPICFFLFCSNGLCLEHNQKRVSENINGWMNDSTLKHTLWSRFGTKETQCDYRFGFGRGFVTNDSDHIVVSFTELWHFSAPDLHLVFCGQAEAKQTQLQRMFPIQVGAQ